MAVWYEHAPAAVEHADLAMELEQHPGSDPFQPGLSAFIGALATIQPAASMRAEILAAMDRTTVSARHGKPFWRHYQYRNRGGTARQSGGGHSD